MASCIDPLDIIPDELEDFVTAGFEIALAGAGIFTENTWKSIGLPQIAAIFNILGYTDEEIHSVQIVTQPIIDQDLDSPFIYAVQNAIRNNKDIVASIKLALLTGPMSSARKYLDYGNSTYYYRLPTSSLQNTYINLIAVQDRIEAEIGEPIEIVTATYGEPDMWQWTNHWMTTNIGNYDSINDWVHVLTEPTELYYITSRVDTGARYEINWNSFSSGSGTWNVEYPVGNYYNISYKQLDTPTYRRYWSYLGSSGVYPELTDPSNLGVYSEELLPIVPLRKEFVSVNDTSAPEYIAAEADTGRTILKLLGLDMDYLIDQIEDNPDIAQIEDVFVLFGTNIYSDSLAIKKVLYILFNNFYLSAPISKSDYEANPDGVAINVVRVEEQTYNATMAFNWISETIIAGSIGDKDTYDTEIVVLPNTPYEEDPDTGVITGGGVNSHVFFRHQHSSTHYTELRVEGLYAMTQILTVSGVFKTTEMELTTDTDLQSNFIIPLALDALDNISALDREVIVLESLHLVLYAADSVHLEWYETPSFNKLLGVVLQFIAVVILFYSWGTATSISAALWALAKQLLIQYILSIALEKLLEEFGDDDAIRALAILAYVYASSQLGGVDATGLVNAEILMNLVTAINIEISYQEKKLELEYTDFLKDAEERQEELDAAQDLLDTSAINPFNIISFMDTNPYETPEDFYTRTIHTGNPGVASLDQIENFIDSRLRLPELTILPEDPSNIEV
jgi:hypothetical protein